MERVKKLVFAVSNDLSYDQRMQRICTTLAEAGYDVTLVGRERNSSIALVEQPYRQLRLNLFFEKGKSFYIALNVRLFFYLLFQKFDAVCGIDLDTAVPCLLVAKLKGKTFVYDAHELFTEVPEVIKRPGVRAVWQKAESFVVRRAKFFYTVSESVAEEFNRRYGNKPEVIRNLPLRNHANQSVDQNALVEAQQRQQNNSNLTQGGTKLQLVETSLPPESNSASVKTIVYRGAVNAGRGVEQAIEAMQRLPNLRLLVAGDGDVLDDAKALVQKLNLGDQITFTGYASPSRLNELTTNAWLGLNLLDGTSMNYRFSLANKFFDFIQCGVPQITMRFPEYERVNNRYRIAMLIDDLRVDALVAAVNALVENEALYRELKLNCIEAAADLCWENERGTLLEFYRSLP